MGTTYEFTAAEGVMHMRFLKGQYIWSSWRDNIYEVLEGAIHMRFRKGQYILQPPHPWC